MEQRVGHDDTVPPCLAGNARMGTGNWELVVTETNVCSRQQCPSFILLPHIDSKFT